MAAEWRGGSCRFILRVPKDLVNRFGSHIKETQPLVNSKREARDRYPAWVAAKKELFAAAHAELKGSQFQSRIELRRSARDAATRSLSVSGSGLSLGGAITIAPSIKELREELDAIGSVSKEKADAYIERQNWKLPHDAYEYFVGCVRNAIEDKIMYDLLKATGELKDTDGQAALAVILKPAREPGEKSPFYKKKADEAEWNLGRRRLTLMQAIGEFKQRKEFYRLGYSAQQAFGDTFAILYSVFGETKEVHTIVPEDMSELNETLSSLPMYIKARLRKGEKLEELIAEKGEKISQGTVNRHITNTKQLWSWLMANLLVKHDPTANLSRQKAVQKHSREVLTPEDIKRIFITNANLIHGGKTDALEFWIPYLGLYTGARRGELLQLNPQDIRGINEVPCFHMETLENDDEKKAKTQKNESSKRIVPVHSKLIELGFLDFVRNAKGNANGKLFSELTWSETHQWKGKVEKFLSRILHPVMGGRDAGKTFHSFRHTVNNRLLWKESVEPGLVDALLGWSSSEREEVSNEIKKDLMRLHYGKNAPAIDRLRDAIECLRYPELD